MKPFARIFLTALLAAAGSGALAAPDKSWVYTPADGVHEVKYFHACYEQSDADKRTRINVVMNGLATDDVQVLTQVAEAGKPATEMFTLKLKNMNASLKLQFRSNDGDHCQQGVNSISFRNAVLRNANDLNALR